MEYIRRMNLALDYIEQNLDGDIQVQEAARLACTSAHTFSRMFGFLAGLPLSEYIRRRRLTLAAFALQRQGEKVIDVALRYGYQSPDAFARAFRELHGISPSAARQPGARLVAYPRLSFQFIVKGVSHMQYRIETKPAIPLVGVQHRFAAPQKSEEVVPAFWEELYETGVLEQLNHLSNGAPAGVHGLIQVQNETTVDYAIVCASSAPPPEGCTKLELAPATWAVFEMQGPLRPTMQEGWRRIYAEWLPTSGYLPAETGELECFVYDSENPDKTAGDYRFEIWLPVVPE